MAPPTVYAPAQAPMPANVMVFPEISVPSPIYNMSTRTTPPATPPRELAPAPTMLVKPAPVVPKQQVTPALEKTPALPLTVTQIPATPKPIESAAPKTGSSTFVDLLPAPEKVGAEKVGAEKIDAEKVGADNLNTSKPAIKLDLPPAPKMTAIPKVSSSSTQGDVVQKEYIAPPTAMAASPLAEMCGHCDRSNRLVLFGDYLYWSVHGVDVPFAQAFDGILPGLSVPRGPVAVVSPRFNSGFRVGGGATFHDGNAGLFGTFTYFETNHRADITAPDPFVLHNFLAFPGTVNSAADSLSANTNYTIRLVMADVDYKCALVNNEHVLLNWLAGVRYAKVDQRLESTFQITGTTTVDSEINFDGVGPRVGLDGKYHVCGGFFGYAQGIVDVLFGQYRANAEQRNVFTGLIGQTGIAANRVVPILELEVGGGWQTANGAIRVSGGYYVGAWFNTLTMTSLANGISGTNFTTNSDNFRDNMTFDGFVLRFELRY